MCTRVFWGVGETHSDTDPVDATTTGLRCGPHSVAKVLHLDRNETLENRVMRLDGYQQGRVHVVVEASRMGRT